MGPNARRIARAPAALVDVIDRIDRAGDRVEPPQAPGVGDVAPRAAGDQDLDPWFGGSSPAGPPGATLGLAGGGHQAGRPGALGRPHRSRVGRRVRSRISSGAVGRGLVLHREGPRDGGPTQAILRRDALGRHLSNRRSIAKRPMSVAHGCGEPPGSALPSGVSGAGDGGRVVAILSPERVMKMED